MSLIEAFLTSIPPETREQLEPSELNAVLTEAWSNACAAWPQVKVDPDVFGAFLGGHVGADARVETIRTLQVKELLLTCAAAQGNSHAIRAIEAHYFPVLMASLSRMRLNLGMRQETCQVLREQLFVRHGEQPPRIANYRGRGDLASWLSVSAVRAAYKLIRKEKRHSFEDDEQLASLAGAAGNDAELESVKAGCRAAFRESFRRALSTLGARDKNLLRQHYLDGLTLEQIAALYQTHRATTARWLAAARKLLLDNTRAALQRHLGVPENDDCESVIRAAQSQTDMTFNRLLSADQSYC